MTRVILAVGFAALLCCAGAAFTQPARAGATLTISRSSPASGPITLGSTVQMKVRLSNITAAQAAGFQAFLSFDPDQLTFIVGSYTTVPFGLFFINPIAATSEGEVDLATGINTFAGQPPTSADSNLAFISFIVHTPCGMRSLRFRPNDPPTRVTTASGASIQPLVLRDAALSLCLADLAPGGGAGGDGVVSVGDLLALIAEWGPCSTIESCCVADITQDGFVSVGDLLALISEWGPCG